jgi:hypothetical protein
MADGAFLFCVLALIANACYSAAYLVDIPTQLSAFSITWKRHHWILWLVRTLFALLLTDYWIADEISPDFRRRTHQRSFPLRLISDPTRRPSSLLLHSFQGYSNEQVYRTIMPLAEGIP